MKLKISPLHPQSNRVARAYGIFNKILKQSINRNINLEIFVQSAISKYNNRPVKHLQWLSPFKIIFGYESDYLDNFFHAKEVEEEFTYNESNFDENIKIWVENLEKSHMDLARQKFNSNLQNKEEICQTDFSTNIFEGCLVLAKFINPEKFCDFSYRGPFLVKAKS